MFRFLRDLSLFLAIQAGILGWLVVSYSRTSDNYLAASIDKQKWLATAPSPRIVFVGGSNLAFGLDSEEVERRLGRASVNMGLYADLGLDFMLREAADSLRSGDVVVVCPEFEHFCSTALDSERSCEAMIQLHLENLATIRYSRWHTIRQAVGRRFTSLFADGLRMPGKLLSQPREAGCHQFPYSRSSFNHYGDVICTHQRERCNYTSTPFPRSREPQKLQRALTSLNWFAARCRRGGVAILCVMPAQPVGCYEVSASVCKEVEDEIGAIVPIIVSGREATLPPDRFFDTDYHLTNCGVRERTALLTDRIGAALGQSSMTQHFGK